MVPSSVLSQKRKVYICNKNLKPRDRGLDLTLKMLRYGIWLIVKQRMKRGYKEGCVCAELFLAIMPLRECKRSLTSSLAKNKERELPGDYQELGFQTRIDGCMAYSLFIRSHPMWEIRC